MIAVGAVAAAFAAIYGFGLLRDEMKKIAAAAATQTAADKIDEVVPGLVEKALRFGSEIPGPEANQIAREIGKDDR
jgi:hypothetical protein